MSCSLDSLAVTDLISSRIDGGCKEQIDIVALRISYDMEYFSRHPNDTLKKMLFTIVLNRFNEHDYRHRKGCFKKTTDCRFHYPRTIQESHELKIDFKAEPSIWYTSYGNGENKTCYPFTMESKRALPDVFLNTNNPIISEVFGFNNNVTIGNRNPPESGGFRGKYWNSCSTGIPAKKSCDSEKKQEFLRPLQNHVPVKNSSGKSRKKKKSSGILSGTVENWSSRSVRSYESYRLVDMDVTSHSLLVGVS